MSIPHGVLYPNQQESNIVAGLLYLHPDLRLFRKDSFHLGMTGELELVKLRANIEVPPPVHFLHEEGIFCHTVMSVKDEGI